MAKIAIARGRSASVSPGGTTPRTPRVPGSAGRSLLRGGPGRAGQSRAATL